ncbi:MobP2 family relaxase [Listeria booriae]|uniref:Relaxase n=1 Tax=Listeria booriae TaxID=1552123 RepID=A0A7X1A9D6_9LIST|nr:MobP2 family relaxase [Listeria booriae]MBC1567215.1 hypothetical protein [Listeria booriae]MBC2164869.1 hypothetical protein [Listeria booriae]MBC2174801.1 hypothetical protein [Listeria booriae]MBC2373696.1 hypothetical protein [Listeria booriae]
MGRPGIVLSSSFVSSTDEKFQKYIEYLDRDEATRNKAFEKYNIVAYTEFNDYMENPAKSSGLFSATEDYLGEQKADEMKTLFAEAQKKQSTLWQDVFSFDNAFLEEEGLYDSRTGELDERKIQQAVRVAMEDKFQKENLAGQGIWTASIHYNTDNIHVHVASVEMENTKPRVYREIKTFNKGTQRYEGTGKFDWQNKGRVKQKTLDTMKSKFANTLIDRNTSLAKIHEISRTHLLKNTVNLSTDDLYLCQLYKDLLKTLPHDRKDWQYNKKEMSPFRKQVNQITDYYLKEKNPQAFEELVQALDSEEEKRLRIYGGGSSKEETEIPQDDMVQHARNVTETNHYKDNKLQELYERAGNKILRELKMMSQDDRKELFRLADLPKSKRKMDAGAWHPPNPFKKQLFNEKMILRNMKKFERAIVGERDQMMHEHQYEQLQQQIYYSQANNRGR